MIYMWSRCEGKVPAPPLVIGTGEAIFINVNMVFRKRW